VNKNYSERTSERIDDEVKKIILRNYARTQDLIENNRKKLVKIAELLLEKEVLTSEEINKIVDGKPKPTAPDAPLSDVGAKDPARETKEEEPGQV